MEPGVYLIKERTCEDHELHKVFNGANWYFGAAGVSGALQSAEIGVVSGEIDVRGPSKPPIQKVVLNAAEVTRFAAFIELTKGFK